MSLTQIVCRGLGGTLTSRSWTSPLTSSRTTRARRSSFASMVRPYLLHSRSFSSADACRPSERMLREEGFKVPLLSNAKVQWMGFLTGRVATTNVDLEALVGGSHNLRSDCPFAVYKHSLSLPHAQILGQPARDHRTVRHRASSFSRRRGTADPFCVRSLLILNPDDDHIRLCLRLGGLRGTAGLKASIFTPTAASEHLLVARIEDFKTHLRRLRATDRPAWGAKMVE